ncbi:MAG TPA: hypothetical protein VGB05_10835, partial [Pyrinomonadaceae bacterium]
MTGSGAHAKPRGLRREKEARTGIDNFVDNFAGTLTRALYRKPARLTVNLARESRDKETMGLILNKITPPVELPRVSRRRL